ncbi:hypothetical protein PO124_14210 [Bacillus licheniformis]|nr:hypothetical protein [Bacillus licheniformis]
MQDIANECNISKGLSTCISSRKKLFARNH